MLSAAHFAVHCEVRRIRNRYAMVVLLAVCSLTVSLATRYCSPFAPSSTTVKTVQTRASTEAKRQRLTKNAANWMPPVVCFGVLQAPVVYSHFASAGPPINSLLSEVSLFNRPPPFSASLS